MSDLEMKDTVQCASPSERKKDLAVIHEDLLKTYYDRLFPAEELIRWLAYGNDSKHPEANAKYFQRREFCFTLQGDIFDARSFRDDLVKRCPSKIDIGPVYNVEPKKKSAHIGVGAGFQSEERELVFDIDMSDYDDVRTISTSGSICNKDWPFMAAAIIILDVALREDFGFQHILWVYSGRRGIHCWVCDKRARVLSDVERTSIVNYFTVYKGQKKGQAKLNVEICSHPAIHRALQTCNEIWINRILPEQQLFESDVHSAAIFRRIKDQAAIEYAKQARPTSDEDINQTVWRVLSTEVNKTAARQQTTREQRELTHGLYQVVLAHVYPRLDVEVSKKMNHLLKAPFCVHPKTGRLCVPIDPEKIWDFSPEDVPTVTDILQQLDEVPAENKKDAVESTDLWPHVKYFQSFLNKMNTSNLSELTSKAKMKCQHSKLAW